MDQGLQQGATDKAYIIRYIGDGLVVKELPRKKWDRPYVLGEKLDAEVQTIIKAMRESGAVINTSIAIATAT